MSKYAISCIQMKAIALVLVLRRGAERLNAIELSGIPYKLVETLFSICYSQIFHIHSVRLY